MEEIEKLILKAQKGDKKAFEEIYSLTYRQVYFTCRAFVKNEQDAADITQEVYLVVLEKINNLKDSTKFENWLGKITVNKCKDFLKKIRPIPMEEEALAELAVEGEELLLPEEYVMNEAKCRILHKIIREELSDTLYQTVVLFYYHNMTAKEIAELLDCPVGTITARLCVARNKIKEAVLKEEKKNNYKLHSLVLVPALVGVFHTEAKAMDIEIPAYVTSATNIATSKIVATGGMKMFKTMQAKIIAAIAATVIVGGGITAGVLISRENKKEENKTTTEYGTTEGNISTDVLNTEDDTTAENNDDEITVDYTAMASSVLEQLETFFEALKTGDIDTVIAMSDETEDCYQTLVEISQYECTEEFLQIFWADMKYYINEENLEDLAYDLENAYLDGDEQIHMNLAYSKPIFFLMGNIYPMAFSDGTILPETPEVNSNEDAFGCLETVMSVMPMCLSTDLWINVPDENGNFKICVDFILGDMELQEIGRLNESYPVTFVYKNLAQASDIVVGDVGTGFDEYNSEIEKMDSFLATKDFEGFEEYICSITGTDYKTEYENTYGSYEALNDEQKNFVDNFVANEMNYKLITYSLSSGTRAGMHIMTMPVLNDLENREISLTENYIEDKVMEYTVVYPGIGLMEQYSEFLWRYYTIIQYASTI